MFLRFTIIYARAMTVDNSRWTKWMNSSQTYASSLTVRTNVVDSLDFRSEKTCLISCTLQKICLSLPLT